METAPSPNKVQASRIQRLNHAAKSDGKYVLYWMQQSQRAEENLALKFAIAQANQLKKMMVVIFCLTPSYPGANLRHYTFMLEGLEETRSTLAARGIRMVLRLGDPVPEISALGEKACLIVCDRGYLSHQRDWRKRVAQAAACPVFQVEADVVVPIEQVSNKAEYAAYTIRPKINRLLNQYLLPTAPESVACPSLDIRHEDVEPDHFQNHFRKGRLGIQDLLATLDVDRRIGPVTNFFKGGTSRAKKRFDHFLQHSFPAYAANRNEPRTADVSGMSPYLHFGQISPLYLALKVKALEKRYPESAAAFLEELIVRRELAANFVTYTPVYDSFAALPNWAKKTLSEHRGDDRAHMYSRSQLVQSQTHDPYWNAAMQEMVLTGYMHNYMRMYWGKKILEWRPCPEDAYDTILDLNNAYFLDGRDPGSYAGTGWILGLHDRAWFERPVFGKVRYMAASGLERKCDIKGYVRKINQMSAGAPSKSQPSQTSLPDP